MGRPGMLNERQLAPPQLLRHQVLDRRGDARAVGRRRPGRRLAREHADVAVRRCRAGPAGGRSRCRGSAPAGSTSQRHCRAGPRGRVWPAVTTTSRYLKIGSLTTGIVGSPIDAGADGHVGEPVGDQDGLLPETATPVDTSTDPANCRVNASISGPATNSAKVEVATTRSCSGAPWAARTAACASAPSTTICDAVASSREPPGVSVMPGRAAGDQLVAEVLAQRGQRLGHRGLADAERVGRGCDRAEPRDQDKRVELSERHGHCPVRGRRSWRS